MRTLRDLARILFALMGLLLLAHGVLRAQETPSDVASRMYGSKTWLCRQDSAEEGLQSGIYISMQVCRSGSHEISQVEYAYLQMVEIHEVCTMYPTLKGCDIDCVDPVLSKIVTIHALGDYKTCPVPYKEITYPTSATVTISFIGDHDLSGPHPVGWTDCTRVTGGVASTGWCPPVSIPEGTLEGDIGEGAGGTATGTNKTASCADCTTPRLGKAADDLEDKAAVVHLTNPMRSPGERLNPAPCPTTEKK